MPEVVSMYPSDLTPEAFITQIYQNVLGREPDASGRRRPVEKAGSNFVLDVDTVVIAIGQGPNPLIQNTTPGMETNKHGNIVADENGKTTKEWVFAGGDIVTGAATVILAMGAGKKAAEAIHEYVQQKQNAKK